MSYQEKLLKVQYLQYFEKNRRHDRQILVAPTSVPNEEGMWAGEGTAESIRNVSAIRECHRSSLHYGRLTLEKLTSNTN
jgi:hypothetical protein